MARKMIKRRTRKAKFERNKLRKPKAARRLAQELPDVLDNWDNTDPEKVEEQLSEVLSVLLGEQLLTLDENELDLRSALAEIFEPESEIVENAQAFENYMNGYFGVVEWDDMESAHAMLSDILEEIKRIVQPDEDQEPKLDFGPQKQD